ncbi:MAG: hypothetical protein KAY50_03910 [Chitinophagaceae bacterium]|nr:hypothetical protein [Chitinophagaceae bacterium]
MKYLSLFIGIATVSLVTGCGSSSTGETMYVPKNDSTAVYSPSAPDTNGIVPTNTITAPEFAPVSGPISITQTPVQTATVSGAGLNPEHGKPGHRCDIAVGAPLNSTPTPQPQAAVTPSLKNTSDISAKNATIVTSSQPVKPAAAGMNPEHGKPGHRCDIAVGAPLDSKPAEVKPVESTVTAKKDVPVTPLLPATTTPTAPTTTPVAAGMNPEHGKPGHRCDIAVGAPLPKQ